MVLGYSRHLFARVVFDQKTETWLALHAEAFKFFGGVPRILVPDNLKAAVIRAAFGTTDEPALNRSYRELARHFGCKIDPTPAYSPEKKGKVESTVKYVKDNALAGRAGEDIEAVNDALDRWGREIAGTRTHGTTGRRPLEHFEENERSALLPLPTQRFEPVVWKQAKVHQDVHVVFDRALYSVPWRLAGREVWLRATSGSVQVFVDETRVATHVRGKAHSRHTMEEHLPEGRRDLRHRSREYWEERARAMGSDVAAFIGEVFGSDDVLYQLRAVQAIVTHLEQFPVTRAQAACRRANFYTNYTYKGIRRILAQALDLEPLPAVIVPCGGDDGPSFRFARNVAELCVNRIEDAYEPH